LLIFGISAEYQNLIARGVIIRCDKRKLMSGKTWRVISVHNQGILWPEPKIFLHQVRVYARMWAEIFSETPFPCVGCNGSCLYQAELFHPTACVNGSCHCLRHRIWPVCGVHVDTKPIITANNQVYRTTATKFLSSRATIPPGCDYDLG